MSMEDIKSWFEKHFSFFDEAPMAEPIPIEETQIEMLDARFIYKFEEQVQRRQEQVRLIAEKGEYKGRKVKYIRWEFTQPGSPLSLVGRAIAFVEPR